MYAIFTQYVVFVSRVIHAIGVCTLVNTCLYKGLCVLPKYHIVYGTMDEKEASLEVAGTECEVVLLVPFGVLLRSIVVAFAVLYDKIRLAVN